MRKILKGVVVPMPTPLDDYENIDICGLENLIEHLIRNRVDGIFILGSMGEFAAITDKERNMLVDCTVKFVKGRTKIFCGIGDCGTKRCINNALQFRKYDIDAWVTLLPFYYPQRRPEENRKFLAEFIHNVDKPVIFYENPKMTRRNTAFEDFEWIKENSEFIGVKDSSGDIGKFGKLVQIFNDRKDFGVLSGTGEQALECYKAGGDGIVPGLGALVPELCRKMHDAGISGQWEECSNLQDKYIRLTRIYGDGFKYWPAAQKSALKMLGIMNDNVASPYLRLDDNEKEYIRDVLSKEGIL